MEFSTGTTPKSAWPASTSWNTSSTDESASARTEWPKCLSVGGLRERALGPEVADLERLFLREAGGHDLAEQAQDFLGAQRTLVPLARHAQHLRLALRAVEIDGVAVGVLGDADLAREARAVVEQLVDARIHGVDLARAALRGRAAAASRAVDRRRCELCSTCASPLPPLCGVAMLAGSYITRAASTPLIARTLSITPLSTAPSVSMSV